MISTICLSTSRGGEIPPPALKARLLLKHRCCWQTAGVIPMAFHWAQVCFLELLPIEEKLLTIIRSVAPYYCPRSRGENGWGSVGLHPSSHMSHFSSVLRHRARLWPDPVTWEGGMSSVTPIAVLFPGPERAQCRIHEKYGRNDKKKYVLGFIRNLIGTLQTFLSFSIFKNPMRAGIVILIYRGGN